MPPILNYRVRMYYLVMTDPFTEMGCCMKYQIKQYARTHAHTRGPHNGGLCTWLGVDREVYYEYKRTVFVSEFAAQGRPDDVGELAAGHARLAVVGHRTAVGQSPDATTLRTKPESRVTDNVLQHHRSLDVSTRLTVVVSIRR